MNALVTAHALDFDAAPWVPLAPDPSLLAEGWQLFRVGTVEGQWRRTPEAYEILTIINREPGNGHLDDVFEWFEWAARQDGAPLRVREVWNRRFRLHLIRRRGFRPSGGTLDVEKYFRSAIFKP